MTKESFQTIAIVALYTLAIAYVVVCTFQTIENISTLGASMFAIKPSFSVHNLIPKTRKYGESTHKRNYGGLHTPIYRVLNSVSKDLLNRGLYGACVVMMARSQFKAISYKSLFHVTMAYGYSSVTIGGRQIFAVDEHSRTIYHIDVAGDLRVTDYNQNYDMSDVIAQVAEAIEVLADCYIAPVIEHVEVKPIRWTLKRVMLDRPYHGAIKGRSVSVVAKFLRASKKQVRWCVEWMDKDNNDNLRIEKGGWHNAYKVEIDGIVAWLPHSILGGLHDTPFTLKNQKACRLDVPEWWVCKNITAHFVAPF